MAKLISLKVFGELFFILFIFKLNWMEGQAIKMNAFTCSALIAPTITKLFVCFRKLKFVVMLFIFSENILICSIFFNLKFLGFFFIYQ